MEGSDIQYINMVSQRPRVTCDKLLHECQSAKGTGVITFISTSVSCETVLYHSKYFYRPFTFRICLQCKTALKQPVWAVGNGFLPPLKSS